MEKNNNSNNKLVIDDTYVISKRKGNGRLVRKVWVDQKEMIIKYSLAYINFDIYSGDNGRVLGYDNNHGYHHKHYYGKTTPIKFSTFKELEALFEKEFEEIHNGNF